MRDTEAGPQQCRSAQPRHRQVDHREEIHVVAAHAAVDDVLAQRVGRQVSQDGVEVGPHVGEHPQHRLQILEIGDQIVVDIGDDTVENTAERPERTQCLGDVRTLLYQHIEGRRNLLQRTVEDIALCGERARQPIETTDGVDDVCPVRGEDAGDVVESRQQLACLVGSSAQRGTGVADDVADLPQAATVDQDRQGRQGFFGRGKSR